VESHQCDRQTDRHLTRAGQQQQQQDLASVIRAISCRCCISNSIGGNPSNFDARPRQLTIRRVLDAAAAAAVQYGTAIGPHRALAAAAVTLR